MDTFVIKRIYTHAPSDDIVITKNSNTDNDTPTEERDEILEQPSAEITANTYKDDNISITITDYRENDTDIHVADVKLSSAEYLKTALAQNSYGKNITENTSEIAKYNNAILAINGDYYASQENGYVLRNGVLYRRSVSRDKEDLLIYKDG